MLGEMFSDNRKIGAGLTAFGTFFLVLGCLLFFDKALLALGNLLFLLGITLLIGFKKTLIFFKRPSKLRGTACFLGGITLVLVGWPVVGMVVEVFGILNLFGNFVAQTAALSACCQLRRAEDRLLTLACAALLLQFPIILSLMRNTPIIGPVLNHPIVQKLTDRIMGAGLPSSMSKLSV